MTDQDAGRADGNGGVRVGFVGLGVMGRPMCRHIATKGVGAGVASVAAFDQNGEAVAALGAFGVANAGSLQGLVERSDVVHLCLPGGTELEAVCSAPGGLLELIQAGQAVIDHGTSPVPMTKALHASFADRGAAYADAPVTRTRQAAEDGTLVTLFGSDGALLEKCRPAMSAFSAEIVHCGAIGAGQVFKQLNNMVLFQTVVALSEALATARAAGVDGEKLFAAFSQGSADSFALRNHGMKALLPGDFPERAFATTYALKDLTYAMELAHACGLDLQQARATRDLFQDAIAQGWGKAYFPSVVNVIAKPDAATSHGAERDGQDGGESCGQDEVAVNSG